MFETNTFIIIKNKLKEWHCIFPLICLAVSAIACTLYCKILTQYLYTKFCISKHPCTYVYVYTFWNFYTHLLARVPDTVHMPAILVQAIRCTIITENDLSSLNVNVMIASNFPDITTQEKFLSSICLQLVCDCPEWLWCPIQLSGNNARH